MRHLLRSVPSSVLPGPLAVLLVGGLLAGCGTQAHAAPHAAPTSAAPVPPAVAARAAALEQQACAAWGKVAAAQDLSTIHDLRVTALDRAGQAARLDPRWTPLAHDLAALGDLEVAYARASVSQAYGLRPRLDALRSGIGKHC